MSQPHGVQGGVYKISSTSGNGPLPYGHPSMPKPLPPHHGPVVHPVYGHYGTSPHFPQLIVGPGPVVPGRPLIGFSTNARINITGPEGLIVTGTTLILLGLICAFAAVSPVVVAPFVAFGIGLSVLGISLKNREKPKPKLEEEPKGDKGKDKQN